MAFNFLGTMLRKDYDAVKSFLEKQKENLDAQIKHIDGRIKRLERNGTGIAPDEYLAGTDDESRTDPLPSNDGYLKKMQDAENAYFDGVIEPTHIPLNDSDSKASIDYGKVSRPIIKGAWEDAETAVLAWKGLKEPVNQTIKFQRERLEHKVLRTLDRIDSLRIQKLELEQWRDRFDTINDIIDTQFNDVHPGSEETLGIGGDTGGVNKLESVTTVTIDDILAIAETLSPIGKELATKVHGNHLSAIDEPDQIFPPLKEDA